MGKNIVEFLRKKSVEKLFSPKVIKNFDIWSEKILEYAPKLTDKQVFDLGDYLKDIFYSTNTGERGQSEVSGGGNSWESLVCWYLNLCLIGRNTVVIKHNKDLIPKPISDAITVNYGNFVSNTESDLIAITFPDKKNYTIDKDEIEIFNEHGEQVPVRNKKDKYNLKEVLDALSYKDFELLEIHIIQCKTNWNDNAQIPMMWDIIYSADKFKNGVEIGKNGYSIHDIKNFTYSFVTVPTVKLEKIKHSSTCVQRVRNLSGGNYWGLPTKSNVASSVKELLVRNLKSGHSKSHLYTLKKELPKLDSKYSYFKIN
ncbi:hypothetical protein H8J79_05215 [Clostridium perfringens]|uniref:hypothetical protein n=1 Tax=Clostridium perfringens TaxID=1502 RepID=UPI0018E45B4C|nr:hypothetical protein [Clostridium perfringens]MBI6020216.1 hypothetical protein [Clostridium perfringens]